MFVFSTAETTTKKLYVKYKQQRVFLIHIFKKNKKTKNI